MQVFLKKKGEKNAKKDRQQITDGLLAGETRFEHATSGFGDRCSTIEPLPYE